MSETMGRHVLQRCLEWDEPTAPTEMLHALCNELLEAGEVIDRNRRFRRAVLKKRKEWENRVSSSPDDPLHIKIATIREIMEL